MATQNQIARHLDLSVRSVASLQADGIIPKDASLDDCRVSYIRNLRERAAGRAAKGEGLDLTTERALLARAQREKLEREIAAMDRKLIPSEEVEADLIQVFSTIRAKLLALPSRMAPLVASSTIPEAHEALKGVIYEALTDLAEYVAGSEDEQEETEEE